MAVTRREQEMLDLADTGMRAPEIAARLCVKPGTVERTLTGLSVNLGADRAHAAAMERGSRVLLAAICAARAAPQQALR
jgi:DNA-binding NarL/FixJ family response regulator